MRFHFDTNAFSEYMRRNPAIDRNLAVLTTSDRLAISAIARGEIVYGIGRLAPGKRRDALHARAMELFQSVACDPVLPRAAEEFAQIRLQRERAGLPIQENDAWIAATAIAHGATLISNDADLRGIRGLSVVDWTAP